MRILSSGLYGLSVALMAQASWTSETVHVVEFLIMLITAVSAATMAMLSSKQNGKMEVLREKIESLHSEINTVKEDLSNWRMFCQSVQKDKLESFYSRGKSDPK